MLTPEFKDFYNVTFGKTKGLKGQLSLSDIKSDIERLKDTVKSIGYNPRQLEEYLQRANASSQTEVQCTLYMVLDQIVKEIFNQKESLNNLIELFTKKAIEDPRKPDFDKADKSIRSVLLKYEPELRAIKEYNLKQNKKGWKS